MTDGLFRLDGRVALVTGAGGSFGRAISRGFARAGAHLFLTDLTPTPLAETARAVEGQGARCATHPGDTGSPEDVEAIFAKLDEAYGQVDVLVNIAGVGGARKRPDT